MCCVFVFICLSVFVCVCICLQWRRSHSIIGGDIKEDWGPGGRKSPSGVQGRAPVGGLGDKVPEKLKLFGETTHNICIKIQQTTVVAVTG